MEQQITPMSCVFKKNWQHYKTCYECGTRKKCTRSDKPNWFGRIIEQIAVWWYRWRINRKLKPMFNGTSKKDVRRVLDQLNKQKKQ